MTSLSVFKQGKTMPLESPVSVLFTSEGVEVAVSASTAIEAGTSGFLAMGSGSNGAQFLTLASDGALYVSGNFSMNGGSVTQSVVVAGWDAGVTGSVYATIVGDVDVNITGTLDVNVINTASVLIPGALGTFVSGANANTVSFQLLPVRASRRGATLWKEGNNSAYVALADTASVSNYTVRLTNNGYFEVPFDYVGPVSVIFNNVAAGNRVIVTEITSSI